MMVKRRQRIDGLSLQSYIIIVGTLNDGHFTLRIEQPQLQPLRQSEALLVDALQSLGCLFAIVIELTIGRPALAEPHLLNVRNEQLYLVIGR